MPQPKHNPNPRTPFLVALACVAAALCACDSEPETDLDLEPGQEASDWPQPDLPAPASIDVYDVPEADPEQIGDGHNQLPNATFAVDASANSYTSYRTYTVWQWNVAGQSMNQGSTTNGMTFRAAASIDYREADLVSLNELCWSQYRDIQDRLRDRDWPVDSGNFSRFVAHDDDHCNGEPYGQAIFSRYGFGTVDRHKLPADGSGRDHWVMCAPLEDAPTHLFCNTHITPRVDDGNGVNVKEQQLSDALAYLEDRFLNGDRVIVAGDFNSQPRYSTLDDWYSSSADAAANPNNEGSYRELDDLDSRCLGVGERTVGTTGADTWCGEELQLKKLDLIFAREEFLHEPYTYLVHQANALNFSDWCAGGPCSDHVTLYGDVTMRLTP